MGNKQPILRTTYSNPEIRLEDQRHLDPEILIKMNNPIPRQNNDELQISNYIQRKNLYYKHAICIDRSDRVLSALNLPIGECFPCGRFDSNDKNEKIILCNFNGIIFEPNKFP